MNSQHAIQSPRRHQGFSLIELLVVIAVISLLAAMVFPITKALNRTKLRTRAKGELALLETAIEGYKAKFGVYPPDSANGPNTNQLYYELSGTIASGAGNALTFQTVDGRSKIGSTDSKTVFSVDGFHNCTKDPGGDDSGTAINFLKSINPNHIAELNGPSGGPIRFIVSSVPWPEEISSTYPLSFKAGANPWRYNSSRPVNNPNSYDLWLDIVVDGKTNRISNWSRDPLIVGTPYTP